MQAAAAWLAARPQLGHQVFARGAPEDFTETDRSRLTLDVPALLRAYMAARRRGLGARHYRPPPPALWSVQDALGRLAAMLGGLPDGAQLEHFLPPEAATPLARRAALASTLLAGLELERGGSLRLRQAAAFGPILVQPHG
jgi:segregation and condensation protein A